MKTPRSSPVRLLALAVLLSPLIPFLAAMFAPMSDRELIDESSLIVQAEFLGQSEVQIGSDGRNLSLGVLKVSETLKGGPPQAVVMLAMPSPHRPANSSDLSFRPGQKGLWFLRSYGAGTKGVYVIDHPQRFVSAEGGQARIESFQRLVRERK